MNDRYLMSSLTMMGIEDAQEVLREGMRAHAKGCERCQRDYSCVELDTLSNRLWILRLRADRARQDL